MDSHRSIVVCTLLGLALLVSGCGRGKGLQRIPLHGTVRLSNGEKISGSISFVPVKGQAGPAANTKLAEGSYTFDRSNGPTAGPHCVFVKRVDPGSRIPRLPPANQKPVPNAKAEWTQNAEISDDGQYLLNLTLED